MTAEGVIEAFRNDTSFVIPEIFSRESKLFKTMDPGLKIAGVTRGWESMFLLFLWLLNTVDPGLKIAGMTDTEAFSSVSYLSFYVLSLCFCLFWGL